VPPVLEFDVSAAVQRHAVVVNELGARHTDVGTDRSSRSQSARSAIQSLVSTMGHAVAEAVFGQPD
jgi:hypothetical protein